VKPEKLAAEVIAKFEAWLKGLGVQTRLPEVGIKADAVDSLTDEIARVSFGPDGKLGARTPATKDGRSRDLEAGPVRPAHNQPTEGEDMTKKERVLATIRRQHMDYLPSQITLADRTRDKELHAASNCRPARAWTTTWRTT